MIQFFNVSKVYNGDVPALQGITLTIEKGDFVFITGKSGAGKSTLLRLIFRAELPSSGVILVNNFNLSRLQRHSIPFLRRNIGVVFQDFKLLPNKTVFENVAFALQVVGVPKRGINQRVMQILRYMGIQDKRNKLPCRLSGGEQQRVAIARAIVNTPAVILADEPTGNLDSHSSEEIMEILHNLHHHHHTIVMVTHEPDLAAHTERIISVYDGCVRNGHTREEA
jgi:cell division transport system ATP-binding protein